MFDQVGYHRPRPQAKIQAIPTRITAVADRPVGLACAGSDDPAPACAFRRPVRAYMRQIATARRRARRWAKGASTRRGIALGEDYLQILPQGHLHSHARRLYGPLVLARLEP